MPADTELQNAGSGYYKTEDAAHNTNITDYEPTKTQIPTYSQTMELHHPTDTNNPTRHHLPGQPNHST